MQPLSEALKKEECLRLAEFLEADKDPGNQEIQSDYSFLEGEDFIGLDKSIL